VAAFYAWLRRHPGLVDGVPAVALAFIGVGQAIALRRYAPVLVLLGLVIALAIRRRYPVGAFVTGIMVGAAQVVAGIRPNVIDVAIVILLYTLAAYRPRRLSVPGLCVCLLGSAVAIAVWRPGTGTLLNWLVTGGIIFAGSSLIAWVLGDSMRYRRAYYAALEDRAARLERERDAQAQIAAAAERARIARELHDVVAHNVSGMVVQADGATYALDSSPERARQALAAIASTGRQALAEMRRMLGVLRSYDGETGVAPLPGIAQLGELLEQTRATGLAVSFTVEGVPAPLPGGLALAAYRIVQESLTNTRKHGGPAASAQVLLRYCEDVLVLQITDDGFGAAAQADGAGHGLTGMRERVALYNGTLQAGPLPGGGYQVTARLPVVRGSLSAADAGPGPQAGAA
jgi:signal transduction histidine kinase